MILPAYVLPLMGFWIFSALVFPAAAQTVTCDDVRKFVATKTPGEIEAMKGMLSPDDLAAATKCLEPAPPAQKKARRK